jgi:hypothetical protein
MSAAHKNAMARPEVRARQSEGVLKLWQNRDYRLKQIAERQSRQYDIDQAMRGLQNAMTPEARAKAYAAHCRARQAAAEHQRHIVAEMAALAGVTNSMRDVDLMRQWLASGLRQNTLAEWLLVHPRTLSNWVRLGIKPRV